MKKYTPQHRYVLADVTTGRFPRTGDGKILTDSLSDTPVFDERDNMSQKLSYYNIIYKGIATFKLITL